MQQASMSTCSRIILTCWQSVGLESEHTPIDDMYSRCLELKHDVPYHSMMPHWSLFVTLTLQEMNLET